jgi:ribosomal protein S18 acetylase RimI-like enzyme
VSEFTIRRYRPADRERVLELMEAALRDAGAFVEDAPALHEGNIAETYFESGGDFLVGVVEGTVVAAGAFRPPQGHLAEVLDPKAGTAELKRVHVHPDYQRRGYASRILAALEARAPEAGFDALVLETTDRQAAAAAFYAKHGFERVARDSITVEGETFELHFYRKELDGRAE